MSKFDDSSDDESGAKAPSRSPNEVDRRVGRRVRLRRHMLGMSIDQLAAKLGVNPQQIQKYETGVNRLGASRLLKVAEVLEIHLMWFFVGEPLASEAAGADKLPAADAEKIFEWQFATLTEQFAKITDPIARDRLIVFAKELATDTKAKSPRRVTLNRSLN